MSGIEIGDSILSRYQQVYGMRIKPPANRVADHWSLEQKLREDLMCSEPANRCQIAEKSYTVLYEELRWHDEFSSTVGGSDNFSSWLFAIPAHARDIYEVGSGQGKLLRELASRGFRCCGTEITANRGKKYTCETEGLRWASTDGVHVDEYEEPQSYDVVISNQVVEHLHPDDLAAHFSSIFRILRPGGTYLVSTPNRLTGPHDVSRVFGAREASGLHLKEYLWRELAEVAYDAGFARVSANTLFRLAAFAPKSVAFRRLIHAMNFSYFHVMCLEERLLKLIPTHGIRTKLARLLAATRLFSDNIHISCTK